MIPDCLRYRPWRAASTLLLAGTMLSGAALAQTVTITDFVLETDNDATVTIPLIEAVDANLDADQIRAILGGEDPDAARRLAELTAAELRVPEIRVAFSYTEDGEDESGEMVYRDLTISGITSGVAASSSLAGVEVTSSDGSTATFDAFSTGTFNLATILQIYEVVEGPEITEPVVLYQDISFAGGSMTAEDGACTFGAFTSPELRGRPLAMSMAEIEAAVEALESADEDDGEIPAPALATMVAFYGDYLRAFEGGAMRFEGLECDIVNDDGQRVILSVGPMESSDYAVGEPFDLRFTDLNIEAVDEGAVRLGLAAIEGIDFTGVLAAIEAAGDIAQTGWPEERIPELLPAVGSIVVRDVFVDVPETDGDGEEIGRIRVSLDEFATTSGAHVNGIPTEVSLRIAGLRLPIEEGAEQEQLQQIRALGYDELDFGFSVGARWDPEDETLHVEGLTFEGADMGSVTLDVSARNATEALFSGDREAMEAAVLELAVTGLSLEVVDAGLRGRALAFAAAEEGQDVASFTMAMSMVAQGAVAGMLAGSDAAMPLAQALGAFIGGSAPVLHVTLTARDEAGIGIAEFMAVQEDPSLAAQLIAIEAAAGGAAAGGDDAPPPPPPPPAEDGKREPAKTGG